MLARPWLMGSPLSTDLILWFSLPNEAADPWWIVCAQAGLLPWNFGLWSVGLKVDIRPVSPLSGILLSDNLILTFEILAKPVDAC